MLKYSFTLLFILMAVIVKAQDTTTVQLKDTISPKGCQFYAGNGFTYFEDENQKNISTDKTVKPGLYNIETQYGLVAKVHHTSKNENIIYYYGPDSIVRKIEYQPYFEITLTKDHYMCHDSDYKMSSIHLYDNHIWLIDFNYRSEDFYIRVLNKNEKKSFMLENLEIIKQ